MNELQYSTSSRFGRSVSGICATIALILMLAILLWLSFVALTETSDMNTNNGAGENIDFVTDHLALNLLTLVLLAATVFGCMVLMRRLQTSTVILIAVLAVLVLSVWFVLSTQAVATMDSKYATDAAYYASMNDGSKLADGYFQQYPFQMGYVFLCEILIRLFGIGNNVILLEIFNAFCLAITYLYLLRMCLQFWGENVTKGCAVLMLLCSQPILFCTFPYGNTPGLMFAVLAVWHSLQIVRGKTGWGHALLAALFIGTAVAIKRNYAIVLAAIIIVTVIRLIRKPIAAQAVCILLCIVSSWGIFAAIQAQYEQRFNLKFGKGVPMISWMAMGLNESRYMPYGWYDGKYTVENYVACGMDPDAAAQQSIEVIRERLEYMREHPDYAKEFFSVKLRSQWNEPTYQSIWLNQVRGSYNNLRGIIPYWICGPGEHIAKGYMNAVQQLVVVAAVFGCVFLLTRRRIEETVLPVCVIGGFLYHAAFEAKPQYIMTYFILLIPLAAAGLVWLLEKIPPLRQTQPSTQKAVWFRSGDRIGLMLPENKTGGRQMISIFRLKKQKKD